MPVCIVPILRAGQAAARTRREAAMAEIAKEREREQTRQNKKLNELDGTEKLTKYISCIHPESITREDYSEIKTKENNEFLSEFISELRHPNKFAIDKLRTIEVEHYNLFDRVSILEKEINVMWNSMFFINNEAGILLALLKTENEMADKYIAVLKTKNYFEMSKKSQENEIDIEKKEADYKKAKQSFRGFSLYSKINTRREIKKINEEMKQENPILLKKEENVDNEMINSCKTEYQWKKRKLIKEIKFKRAINDEMIKLKNKADTIKTILNYEIIKNNEILFNTDAIENPLK